MNLYFYLSLISAMFVFMIDYGLGTPADDHPGYGSFLFKYSFWLARTALGDLHKPIYGQYLSQLSDANDKLTRHQIKREYQQIVFTQGRQLFSWQKAFGMCPYCTHFWFTLFLFLMVNIFYYKENIITFSFYFLLSHLLIRLFKRWI